MHLPHRANQGEIIRVRDYEHTLWLVTELNESFHYNANGEEAYVSYTCQNVDNYKDIIFAADEDVMSIVVTADKSDEYIDLRQKSAQPPAVQKPKVGDIKIDLEAFFRAKQGKDAPAKKVVSEHEKKRIEAQEKRDYIDYLLDVHSMLADLEELVGPDETRQLEMRMIKEEFEIKSAELRKG